MEHYVVTYTPPMPGAISVAWWAWFDAIAFLPDDATDDDLISAAMSEACL